MAVSPNLARVSIVEPLRGVAALAVCWYHFTVGPPLLRPLSTSGVYGWLGVDCFFVISAFVIPLSMYRGGYTLRTGWRTFVAKRVTRLDPPYLVAVVVSVALAYASALAPGYAGRAPHITVPQLLAHLGYLNAFLAYPWVNPVFWTLAVEFQYYMLIALAYAPLTASDSRVRVAGILALGAAGLVPSAEAYLPHFLTVFAIGLATFQRHVGLLGRTGYAALLVPLTAAAWWTLGPAVATTALATALTIACVSLDVPQKLRVFGTISYSLYLLHFPIGGRVVNIGLRFAHSLLTQVGVVVGALAASLLGAYACYLLVEKPAQSWSASFRYPIRAPDSTGEML